MEVILGRGLTGASPIEVPLNLILFHSNEINDNREIVLRDRRFEHIAKVHQPKNGSKLKVGQIDGQMGLGEVKAINENEILIEISQLDAEAPQAPPIHLMLALPRPKNYSRILQTVVSLGVKRISFFHSYRVEKSFWQSDLLNKENTELNIQLGLEQSVDTQWPEIQFYNRFKPFVEDQVSQWITDHQNFVAHPITDGHSPVQIGGPMNLVIGPEGGLIDYEVNKFAEQGFKIVKLSDRILKVENAIVWACSRLSRWPL